MNCSFCAATGLTAAPTAANASDATAIAWSFIANILRIVFWGPLLLFRAIPGRDALLLGVLRRGGLDHGTHQALVRLDPVADPLPLLAVPLLELHLAAAFVVGAGHLERLHEAGSAQLLQALLVDVQVLEAPAHLLAGHRLALAVVPLRGAHRLGGEDRPQHAAVVVDRAQARLVLELALVLGVDVLL